MNGLVFAIIMGLAVGIGFEVAREEEIRESLRKLEEMEER